MQRTCHCIGFKPDGLISILYDKIRNLLCFIPIDHSANQIVAYNIEDDKIDMLSTFDPHGYNEMITKETYHNMLSVVFNNRYIQLYFDVTKLEPKFTDNLFGDNRLNILANQIANRNVTVT